MITTKDRKALSLASRKPGWYTACLLALPLFFFAAFAKELYLASAFGDLDGHTLKEILELWWAGISLSKQYPGPDVAAIVRVERAIGALALFIAVSGMVVIAFIYRNREARIVAELKAAGRWES